MSILDSQEERDAAVARLASIDDAQLLQDLAYWVVAERQALLDHNAGVVRQSTLGRLHHEAVAWNALIADALIARRSPATTTTREADHGKG